MSLTRVLLLLYYENKCIHFLIQQSPSSNFLAEENYITLATEVNRPSVAINSLQIEITTSSPEEMLRPTKITTRDNSKVKITQK